MTIPIIPNYAPGLAYGAYADLTAQVTVLKARVSCPGAGAGHALIIGDSLANQLIYSAACSDWLIMCGVGGMRAHDFLPWVPQIMAAVQPSDVIIALGKNDMAQGAGTPNTNGPYWCWQQDYWWLANAVKNPAGANHDATYTGVTPVLMTIIPTEQTVGAGLAAFNNPTLLAQFNDYIANPDPTKGVGAAEGCPVQDAFTALKQSNGYLPAGSTVDGVHPQGALQQALWGQFVAALQTSRAARGASTANVLPSLIP